MRLLLPIAALLACQTALRAQVGPAHSLALINDPRSHGRVGDRLLSLNEAIRLSNQTLALSQLSGEELARINGFGDIAFAEIDARAVPVLTLERDLDVILDTSHGFLVGGSFGTPVVEIGQTRGFVADSNFADFRNLRIRGGSVAIRINFGSTLFGSQIEGVTFEGQSECALRVVMAADRGDTRLMLKACTFPNLQRAVEILDVGRDRGTVGASEVFVQDCRFVGCGQGLTVTLGPGGRSSYLLERNTFLGTTDAIRFLRPSALDTRELIVEAMHLTIGDGMTGLSVQALPNTTTTLILRMLDLQPRSGGLGLGGPAAGDRVRLLLEDSRLAGRLELRGGGSLPLQFLGNRARGATLDIAASGAPVTLSESILDGCTLNAGGSSAVTVDGCLLLQGSVQAAAPASVTVQDSHVQGTVLGAQVSNVRPLPAPQLGAMEIDTATPVIGGRLQLQAELAPMLSGFWILGQLDLYPVILPRPYHFYWITGTEVILTRPSRNRDRVDVPLPNDPGLIGHEGIVQMAIVPDPQLQAPPLSLPPGRRFMVHGPVPR
jgi:hypothetical protein